MLKKKDADFEEINIFREFIKRLNDRYFSSQLDNFLCFSTRFQEDERLTVEQALNHMYFVNFDPETYISTNKQSINSLFKLFVASEKTDVPKFYAANILKLLCSYYLKGNRWYMLKDAFTEVEPNDDPSNLELGKDSPELEYLQYELGTDIDFLWNHLNYMINSNYQLADI